MIAAKNMSNDKIEISAERLARLELVEKAFAEAEKKKEAFKQMKKEAMKKHLYKHKMLFAFFADNSTIVNEWLASNGKELIGADIE